MAVVNNVPQLVNKKRGSYADIALKLEPEKFNGWKKRMLCYLAGMEPYYLKCIKDGPFKPKTTEGDDKPESQWTLDERRVVVQEQRLKSIIMSCLPDDIIESVISRETAKATWAKPTESLSQTYTRYRSFLNKLANDGVNLSKHETNVGFVNSLPEKWLTFSRGLRNANHTQTLDLADIYEKFVYEDNLIQRRASVGVTLPEGAKEDWPLKTWYISVIMDLIGSVSA
nr:retrovirus-related Pol polyprotein from transposon TNT 1-94 [Tanacetum cinerariifolium]